ncbi:MAG TPA: hypothetical protein DCP90_08175 [Clostridiales bacterium]|nr:MAG: hypothetical protein A2Y22_01215 [Clostridiales bacterium GWD2_32_59]HAN10568.1 hypothetical protein [Clostridiales bacterium]
MSTITFKTKQINNSTPIANIFIEKYLPKANATYVKIYIYLYRFFYTNTQTSIKSVSSNLSLLESDVINAIKYWESVGLMSLETDTKANTYCINFVNLNDPCLPQGKLMTADLNNDTNNKKFTVKEHTYDPQEVGHILKYNTDIKEFIGFVESKYAASFSPKNLNQIINMFDSLILSIDVYKFLVTYTHTKGITNINSMLSYIEKIAVSLCEKNITTLEDAEKYLSGATRLSNNQTNTQAKENKAVQTKSNNKFMNFDQQNWDFEEIKRQEQEFIEDDYKRILEKNRKVD